MYDLIQTAYREAILKDASAIARGVKRDLDTTGIAMLPDFFTPDAIKKMRETSDQNYERCLGGEKRIPLIDNDLKGTILYDLAKSDFVQAISNPILRPFGYHVDKSDVYAAVNILQGPKGRDVINNYHFDATLLTLVVPIYMPDVNAPRRGSFRIWPNVRKFSTSSTWNKIHWKIMLTGALRDRYRNMTVDFLPGNLYFFYGFRSWHGTGDMDDAHLRVNCLLNVGGPVFFRDKKKTMLPVNERREP